MSRGRTSATGGAGFVFGLLLTACKPEIGIEVTATALPQPAFRLRMEGEAVPRFTRGTVTDAAGATIWSFEAEVPGVTSGAEMLAYGTPPAGFRTVLPVSPLEVGASYVLLLEGKGLGRKSFVPTAPD